MRCLTINARTNTPRASCSLRRHESVAQRHVMPGIETSETISHIEAPTDSAPSLLNVE